MTNFKVGDPYVRVDDGYARLPGAGYEALHPELEGLNPEDYPDIHKLRILSDVAPYSREYNQVSPSCLTQKPHARAQAETPFTIRLSPGLLLALWSYATRASSSNSSVLPSPKTLPPAGPTRARACSTLTTLWHEHTTRAPGRAVARAE
jgi:hypothetical protein